jgi:hypothetical protein
VIALLATNGFGSSVSATSTGSNTFVAALISGAVIAAVLEAG